MQLLDFLSYLLLLSGTRACFFPTFLRFHFNQAWLSSWTKEADDTYSTILLSGTGGRMAFHKRTMTCQTGRGCTQLGEDHHKSTYDCVRKLRHQQDRFVVRSAHGSWDLYCVEIIARETLTRNPDLQVFYLRWGNLRSDTSGQICTFLASGPTYEHGMWIPSPLQNRTWWNNCPFSGGFQALMSNGRSGKPVCSDDRLVRFDVECVAGEGALWVFPRPECNPFTGTLECQFHCYLAWRHHQFTNVILFNSSWVINMYTLRYEEDNMRTIMTTMPRQSRPRPFFRATIFKNAVERSDNDAKARAESSTEFYQLSYRVGNPQDPDCDDSVINCANRCHETHAYINCKRTCPRPRDECLSNRENSKCKFKNNYRATWTVGGMGRKHGFVTVIDEDMIEFLRPNGKRQLRASCYNEIQSSRGNINDRYVVEVKGMPKGCRRRRLCLELHQGPYIMRSESNKNTLRFRLSGSKIAGLYTDHRQLCRFNPGASSVGGAFMTMMVGKEQTMHAGSMPEKCGFYRSMDATVIRGQSSSCQRVTLNDWSATECEFHGQLHVQHGSCRGKWPEEELREDHQCVSTFYTSHLGLTVADGENGNLQMHVTKNLRTKEFNCWFFDKTGTSPKLYRFPTADCVITERTQRSITVDKSQATAIYTIVGDGERPCTKWRDSARPENQGSPRMDRPAPQLPQERLHGPQELPKKQGGEVYRSQDALPAQHQESMYRSSSSSNSAAPLVSWNSDLSRLTVGAVVAWFFVQFGVV